MMIDDIQSSPRAAFLLFIFTQPRAVLILSIYPKYIQSYLSLAPSVVSLVVVRSSCTSSGREKFSQFVSSDNQLVQIEVPNRA